MFKLRSAGQGATGPTQPPTIDSIRRRARHRLIGASVLVLAAVIGFPLLFDAQPRPLPVDLPIDIPSRQSTPGLAVTPPKPQGVQVEGLDGREEAVAASPKPSLGDAGAKPSADPAPKSLPAPAAPPLVVAAASAPSVPAARAPAAPSAPTSAPAAPAPATPVSAPSVSAPPPKVTPAPVSAPPPHAEAARAQALLDGKPDATPARVVVQVGAFAEQARAQDVRKRLEQAGLKTYTHVADTAEGKRIRVRVGPFDSRTDADKAAQKVKALGFPAAVLVL